MNTDGGRHYHVADDGYSLGIERYSSRRAITSAGYPRESWIPRGEVVKRRLQRRLVATSDTPFRPYLVTKGLSLWLSDVGKTISYRLFRDEMQFRVPVVVLSCSP